MTPETSDMAKVIMGGGILTYLFVGVLYFVFMLLSGTTIPYPLMGTPLDFAVFFTGCFWGWFVWKCGKEPERLRRS